MKKVKFLLVAIFCVSMMMLALNASATMYVNEDFENGTTAVEQFVDQNWGDKSTSVTAWGAPELLMGKSLKVDLQLDEATPTTMSMTKNQGSPTATTFFTGKQSNMLIGDQATNPGPDGKGTSSTLSMLGNPSNKVPRSYLAPGIAGFRIWQFAVRTDANTVQNAAAGTQIGHFRIAYSTDGTTAVGPNAGMALRFLVNSKKTVDMVCTTTLKKDQIKIGEFGGSGPKAWSVVTIVQNEGDAARWICTDGKGNFKGPQPLVNNPSTTTITDSDWYFMPTGYSIFVNRNDAALVLTPADNLGAKWGTTSTQASPVDFGWEMSAENEGIIYVDRLLWVNSDEQNYNDRNIKINNRLLEFDAVSAETSKAAAGPSWMLY